MKTRYIYLVLFVLCVSLSVSSAHPSKSLRANWITEDETVIDKDWMLFPDDEGNIFNISLKGEHSTFTSIEYDVIDEVTFWLYTRKNCDDPYNLILNEDESLLKSNFKRNVRTKIIIHGWKNNRNSNINKRLVKAYLPDWDVNVIVVDWGNIAQSINYYSVRNNIPNIGKVVADFIHFLVRVAKINLNQVHIVGHSLGAHIAGYAGSQINSSKILAITGLDPALPLFSINDPENRLDETDASYVEVIHTDAGRLGFALPLGHVDFYPNRGTKQPGCGMDVIGRCGHSRAVEYFEESLRYDEGFLGKPCESYEEVKNGNCSAKGEDLRMGGKTPKLGYRGQYLLRTAATVPYGQVNEYDSYDF